MKTIRNQLKYPIGLQLRMLLCKGIKIKTSSYLIFHAVEKNNKKTTKRNSTKTCHKSLSMP